MPTVTCNGADLYYEERGEGRPVVFLHGAWCGVRFFDDQMEGLSDAFRTIALDFRGHGRSETTEDGYTLAQHARDTRAFLEALELDDVVLVGWSMGALVSWDYVRQFGTERLAGLVDVDMEATSYRAEGSDRGSYDAQRLREIHATIQDDHLEFIEMFIETALKDPPTPRTRSIIVGEMSRVPPAVKSCTILDASLSDYVELLPKIDVPSLVLAGADEKWRSVASVQEVADLVPDARFELLEESGHCLTLEEPERVNEVVRDFVETI